MRALPIYIGYDEREHEAYEVCRSSALRRSSQALHIVKIDQAALRRNGLYAREWRYQGDEGQRVDLLDGRPFSTDFSFSRFLVPALALYQGWALYCDCDFLFLADLASLFDLADDRYAALCVQHRHTPRETVKMTGLAQTSYHRKNWSSLVLWNCSHPAHRTLTPRAVNYCTGQWLHAFQWLKDDEEIGELPLKWNWLAGVNQPLPDDEIPCAVHFTLGVPSIHGCENSPYADLWLAERQSRRAFVGGPTPSERLRAIA